MSSRGSCNSPLAISTICFCSEVRLTTLASTERSPRSSSSRRLRARARARWLRANPPKARRSLPRLMFSQTVSSGTRVPVRLPDDLDVRVLLDRLGERLVALGVGR
jgi:hypothetical protein